MIKVKDEPDLARDTKGVIQNVNTSAYRDFIARRNLMNQDRDRISALEQDNAEIKDSLAQILKLLKGG
jgi:phosphoenolpyruvate synthase/pyruvate phosphate dikinase